MPAKPAKPAKPTSVLSYVETEGGPFILLPMELKKAWKGAGGDEDDEDEDEDEEEDEDEDEATDDYERAEEFLSTVGVLDVGKGQALILGEAEVTAFHETADGGVFVQRVHGDDAAQVLAAVREAVASGAWEDSDHTLRVEGKGKLALFDSACMYEDADEDEILKVSLAPGLYVVETSRVKTEAVEAGLVRLRRKSA